MLVHCADYSLHDIENILDQLKEADANTKSFFGGYVLPPQEASVSAYGHVYICVCFCVGISSFPTWCEVGGSCVLLYMWCPFVHNERRRVPNPLCMFINHRYSSERVNELQEIVNQLQKDSMFLGQAGQRIHNLMMFEMCVRGNGLVICCVFLFLHRSGKMRDTDSPLTSPSQLLFWTAAAISVVGTQPCIEAKFAAQSRANHRPRPQVQGAIWCFCRVPSQICLTMPDV